MVVTQFAADPVGSSYATNVTLYSFAVPGGVQADDIIEFAATTTSSTMVTMTPSHVTGSIAAAFVSPLEGLQVQSWYYRVPSTIPVTITVTLSAARQGSLVWRVLRGVHTTTALDATPTAFSNTPSQQTTITIPSITTVTADAYVCAQISNGSGSGTLSPLPAGWTLVVDPTRRNGFLVTKGTQAVAGASGAATVTWPGGETYGGRAVTVAWRAASTGPATPALLLNLTRPSTSDSFYVSTRTTDATSVRVKAATNSALTTGVVFGSAGTPDSDGYSRSTVTGLAANTHYYYGVEMTDTGSGTTTTAKVGEAWTLPTPGVPCASWTIGFGSCHDFPNQGGTSTAYTNMFAHSPQMVWSLGDTPYADTLSTSVAVQRGFMEAQLANVSGWAAMNANYCTQYTKSDHDSSDNDSGTGAWTGPNRAATLQMFPQDGRPDPLGLYRAEAVGRVRIIHIDTRYFSTPSTKLGATQLAWLKAQFLEPEPVKLLVQDGVWIDDRTPDPVDDTWAFYAAERQEIADAPRVGNIYGASGDQHAISADDGTHNLWGGWPTVCAAPFRNNASHKTENGPADWTNGIYPTTEGAVVNQHGTLTLLDDGTDITVQFRGYDGSNVARVSMDTVFETSAALVGSAADTAGISDTASAGAIRPRTQGDGVGATDAATLVVAAVRAPADTVGATDAVTASLARTAGAVDGVSVGDTTAVLVSAARTQGDALGVTDAVSSIRTLGQVAADGVGLADALSTALSTVRSTSDTTTVTDVVTVTLGGTEAVSDGVGVTDAPSTTLAAGRSSMDTTAVSDQAVVSMSAARTQLDGVGVADLVTVSMAGAGEANPTDGVGVTDAVSVVMSRVHTVADFLAIVDAASNGTGAAASASDGVGITDAITRALARDRGPLDTVGLTDQASSVRGYSRAPADMVGVGDAAVAALERVRTVTLTDTIGVVDVAYVQTVLPEAAPDLFTLTAITPMLTLTPMEVLP